MSLTITRTFEWDAGHRVLGHESKCANLHGHRYKAEVTVTAPKLDEIGRVIDFSQLKFQIGTWIDIMWDHNMILHPEDPMTHIWSSNEVALALNGVLIFQPKEVFGQKTPFIMPKEFPNPTAENMVQVLAKTATMLLEGFSMDVTRIRLYETPNCWADWEAPPGVVMEFPNVNFAPVIPPVV